MNSFVERHHRAIRFGYSCFDRIICQGMIPAFQHSKRSGTIVWFLRTHRGAEPLDRNYFGNLARNYRDWVETQALAEDIPLVEPEKGCRREDWVQPYYERQNGKPGIAVILKSRESERICIHEARTSSIQLQRRWVNVYYFYLHDAECGRMFLRVCPYFPFHVRVWMNGHNWLASKMRREGIAFVQRDNLFTACDNPQRLQQLADAFAPEDLRAPVEGWLSRLVPFFTPEERAKGFRHQLFMNQIEYCNNLIFHDKATLERLFDRLMDSNRGMGHPDKLAVVFGRPHFQPDTRTGQTVLKITARRTPVITSSFQQTSIKQYVSHGVGLRTESTTYQMKDISLRKNLDHLPKVRDALGTANERYLEVQQDVMHSYVDRGQLQQLRQPTVSAQGRRVPGLRIDDPRLLAVLQALIGFIHLVGRGCFRTGDLLADVRKACGNDEYGLSQLRYDLSKLRGKGLIVRVGSTRSYRLTPEGYRIAILYLKLYQRLYAPLTSSILDPAFTDHLHPYHSRVKLDRLYLAVDASLQKLTEHLGIATAASA